MVEFSGTPRLTGSSVASRSAVLGAVIEAEDVISGDENGFLLATPLGLAGPIHVPVTTEQPRLYPSLKENTLKKKVGSWI